MDQAHEFPALALLNVIVVIEVLPAAGGVFADCLNPARRGRVDRDVGPGGWNFQLIDASHVIFSDLARVDRSKAETTLWRAGTNYARGLDPFDRGHGKMAASGLSA